jgi:hypothetical protein
LVAIGCSNCNHVTLVLRKMSSQRGINGLQPLRVTMLTLRRRLHNEAQAGDCGLSVGE